MDNKRIKRSDCGGWEVLWQDVDGFPQREVFYTIREARHFNGYDELIEPISYGVGLDILVTYQEW